METCPVRNLSRKEMTHINTAATEATNSELMMRHGAVAVQNGKCIAKGHNNYRTYSSDNILDPAECCTCHAECDVLHKLLKIRNLRRNNITMYIVRIGQSGELRESAPCHHCHEKMLFFGIKTLIYSKEVSRNIPKGHEQGQHQQQRQCQQQKEQSKNIMFVKCSTASFIPTVITTGQKWITKSLKYQEEEKTLEVQKKL
jgi:deoxycytidylate deaminase